MIYLPSYIEYVLHCLNEHQYAAHIVGGCVRDMLMGREPNDFDVTTNALPEQIKNCFINHKQILTGVRHGTVSVLIDGNFVEITTYRIDGEYFDNRHPQSVQFTECLENDLARRDFTINAMAKSLTGELFDPFNGKADIDGKLIRCVGDPKTRFCEDALRIMRALRFASTLGFDIDTPTSTQIHESRELLRNISHERIQSELFKLLCGERVAQVLCEYRDVFEVFFSIAQCEVIKRINKLPCDTALRLSGILTGVCDYVTPLRFLKISNSLYKEVEFLLEQFMSCSGAQYVDIKRLLGTHGEVQVRKLIEYAQFVYQTDMTHLHEIVTQIVNNREPCCISDLAITGRELISIGISGAQIGECLEVLLDDVLHEIIPNTSQALAARAFEFYKKINNGRD